MHRVITLTDLIHEFITVTKWFLIIIYKKRMRIFQVLAGYLISKKGMDTYHADKFVHS